MGYKLLSFVSYTQFQLPKSSLKRTNTSITNIPKSNSSTLWVTNSELR